MRAQFILFLFALIFTSSLANDDSLYTYMTYKQIETKLKEYQQIYPTLFQLQTTQELYGLPALDCGDIDCYTYVVTLTDFNEGNVTEKPQVYLSGALHGNERIGPNVVIYLLDYLLTNYETDEWIQYLIKTRVLVTTPMTNAQGYYYDRRTEVYNGEYLDPNRDFPYDVVDDQCMDSITGRSVLMVFRDHMFVLGITFHGGTNALTYEWGSYSHAKSTWRHNGYISENPPDLDAMKDTAELLSDVGGTVPEYNIKKYPTGPITEVVYPCHGGMEDWAYAASWGDEFGEAALPDKCDTSTYGGFNNTLLQYQENSIRLPLFLIETDNHKEPDPDTLGTIEGIKENGTEKDGHISRNIRISLALIDLATPYIKPIYAERNGTHLNLQWSVGGSLHVNYTYVEFDYISNEDLSLSFPYKTQTQSGFGLWKGETKFNASIEILPKQKIVYRIIASTDQNWKHQEDPKPNAKQQTHFARIRTQDQYNASTTNSALHTTNPFYSKIYYSNETDAFHLTSLTEPQQLSIKWIWILAIIFIFGGFISFKFWIAKRRKPIFGWGEDYLSQDMNEGRKMTILEKNRDERIVEL